MDLKLKVLEGKNAGQKVPVAGPKFFIGRADDCQLRPASELISRHHCVLLVEDTYLGVRDFGSKNGTYVNGERVAGERELKAGDQLKVGPLEFEIEIAHGIGGKKRPAVADLKEAAARTAESSSNSKFDVADWLADDAADVDSPTMKLKDAKLKETHRLRLGDTETVPLGATAEAPAVQPTEPPFPAATVPSATGPAADESAIRKKQPAGKLPPIPKQVSKDSQEAAASVLNKLRRRR